MHTDMANNRKLP